MAAGLLSTILDTTGERLKERLAESHDLDKEMRDTQTQALVKSIYALDENGKPKLTPAQTEEAWGRIEQLHKHNKNVKDILLKARDITEKIFGMAQKPNGAMADRGAQQTIDALGGGQGGSLVPNNNAVPLPNAAGGDNSAVPMPNAAGGDNTAVPLGGAAPYTPPPPVRKQPVQQVAQAASQSASPPQRTSTAQLIQAGAPPSPMQVQASLENLKAGHAQDLQKIKNDAAIDLANAKTKPEKVSYKGKDGKMHVMLFNPKTAEMIGELTSDGNVEKPRSWVTGASISGDDAKKRVAAGEVFHWPDGTVIDVSRLGPEEELKAWAGGDAGSYSVFNQNTRQLIADNTVYTYPALSPDQKTVQGQARTGTETTTVQPFTGVTPTGETIQIPGSSTSTPVTPKPAAPAAVAPPAASPVAPAAPAGPVSPPPARQSTPPAGQPQASNRPQSRVLTGAMTPAQLKTQRDFVTPVRESMVQILGDPNNPAFRGLAAPDLAALMDDPKARERVGTAARMIIEDLAASEKSGGVGAAMLGQGINLQGGDVWQALKNKFNITQWIAGSEASATEKVVSSLSPKENELLTQLIAAYSSIVGLRKVIGGSAYKFATEALERDLPIPGRTNVASSRDYYRKIASLVETAYRGYTDNGIRDDMAPEKAFYKSEADRLAKLGSSAGPTPPPSRQTSPQSTDRIRVTGPNGEKGTVPKGSKLPTGWSEAK